MQFKSRSSRFVALFTGAVMASVTLFPVAPARADKAETLKYGAIGLGAISAYLLSKGKTVPAAAVAAGGYYAYKKSQDAKNEARYGYNPNSDYNYESGYGDTNYPDSDYGYDSEYNTDYESGYDANYRSNSKAQDRQNRRAEKKEKRAERRANKQNGAGNFDLSPYLR